MNRQTQHLVLVMVGGALIKITVDDVYLRYVKPGHRWWLLAAGTIIVVLAMVTLVRDLLAARVDASAGQTAAHDHEHHDPRSPWLLVLPVLAIFLVPPPALGADSVTRSGSLNAVDPVSVTGEFRQLPPGEAPELTMSDFVSRAVWDRSGSLTGHDVTLTGFVVRRGAATELARMVLTCCAADARPMVVRLVGVDPGTPVNSWLRVRARLLPGSATTADGYIPSARVTDAELISAPTDPYEF